MSNPRTTGTPSQGWGRGTSSHVARARRSVQIWMNRRRPLVRQDERTDCGPAALLTVLRHWGGDASLPEIRQLAGTDRSGTTLLGLSRAADALGMKARGARGTYQQLIREELPCVAHLVLEDRRPHYVVVFRMDRAGVWIGDPAQGQMWMSRSDFEDRWHSHTVLLLQPTAALRFDPPPGWIGWLAPYFASHRAWLLHSFLLGVCATTIGLLTAVFVQWLIDRFIPERNVAMILSTGLVLAALLIFRSGAAYLRQRFLLRVHRRVSLAMNEQMLVHLFHLPQRFFEGRATGDISARLSDGMRIQGALLQVMGVAVIDGTVVVGSFVFLFGLAAPLGVIALATIPLYVFLLLRVSTRVRNEQNAVLSAYAQGESHLIEGITGFQDILGFNASGFFARGNLHLQERVQERVERLGRLQAGISLFVELTGGVLIIVALVWGALLVVGDVLLLGQLMAGYSLLAGMLPSIERMVESVNTIQEASVSASRLRDLLLTPTEESVGGRPFSLEREIRLEKARFVWPSGREQLRNVDMRLPRGSLTGIWGPNGSGKSTLVQVLSRHLHLTRGGLLVDDTPADSFALSDYRRNVAMLPTSVHLFHGTVAHNLMMGRPIRDAEAVIERLSARPLTRFVDDLPARWQTLVGEGARRLSAGERQVIGLLRALVGLPDVLLVDEGLRSADDRTSAQMLDVLLSYAIDRTVLLVSHEPRLLVRVDHLYLLRDGRIADSGPAEQVLGRHGLAEVAPLDHGGVPA